MTTVIESKKRFSKDLINLIEQRYLNTNSLTNTESETLKVGDIIRIGYKLMEGDKERIQFYEGLVIAIQNKTLGKTFTMRRSVQGIGIEQVFLFHSPKIISVTKKQSSKVRRAKLYFIRNLKGKSSRLKVKR
jgi:large subunit ribosomal protein L19